MNSLGFSSGLAKLLKRPPDPRLPTPVFPVEFGLVPPNTPPEVAGTGEVVVLPKRPVLGLVSAALGASAGLPKKPVAAGLSLPSSSFFG